MPQTLQEGQDAATASNDGSKIAESTETAETTSQNSRTEDLSNTEIDEPVLPQELASNDPSSKADDWDHPPHLQGIAAVATDGSFIVEFSIMPDGVSVEETCRLGDSIIEVKTQIATRLHLQPEHVIMKINDDELDGSKLLEHYNPDHKPRLGIELSIGYRKEDVEPFQMPDTIQVNCEFGDGSKPMPVFVKLEKSVARKPFLGGFRHRQTRLEFHNASSQTLGRRGLNEDDKQVKTLRYHRETQTPNMKSRTQQTTRECGTQMERAALYLDRSGERVVKARKYSDSSELLQLKIKMATRIQCFVRFTFARRRTRALLNHRNEQHKLDEDIQRQEMATQEAERERQIERRIHPRTRNDFRTLLEEMDAWREHETNRIKANVVSNETQGERNLALQDLMDKELRLLQTIDSLRIEAAGKNRQCSAERRLARMAAPQTCVLPSSGEKVAVETPQTIRARELMELYSGLAARELSMDERLDVLLHVKWTVKEFDGPLIRELVELIDREADLLNRGRSSNSLSGLRRRMTQLFEAFANTPNFNPAAHIFSNVITRA